MIPLAQSNNNIVYQCTDVAEEVCKEQRTSKRTSFLTEGIVHLTGKMYMNALKACHTTGRKIAPNTGPNVTKYFTLVTKL